MTTSPRIPFNQYFDTMLFLAKRACKNRLLIPRSPVQPEPGNVLYRDVIRSLLSEQNFLSAAGKHGSPFMFPE
jgi:hypothetical protein